MSYLVIQQSYQPQKDSVVVPDPFCPQGAMQLLDESSDYRPLLDESTKEFTAGFAQQVQSELLRGSLNELLSAATGHIGPNQHIAKQRLFADQAQVTRLEYDYADNAYKCWLVGHGEEFYAPCSPITEFTEKTLDEALELWKGIRRFKAAEVFTQVEDMGKADLNCQNVLNRRADDIPAGLKAVGTMQRRTKWLGGVKVALICLGMILLAAITIGVIVHNHYGGQGEPALTDTYRESSKGPLSAGIGTQSDPTNLPLKDDTNPPAGKPGKDRGESKTPPQKSPPDDLRPRPDPPPKKTPPETREGTLVLKARTAISKGVDAWVEVDGKRSADWKVDTKEVELILAAGKYQIAVYSIYRGVRRTIFNRPITVIPNTRTDITVGP